MHSGDLGIKSIILGCFFSHGMSPTLVGEILGEYQYIVRLWFYFGEF